MSENLECFKSLLPILNSNHPYAIFDYRPAFKQSDACKSYDIVLSKKDVKPVLYNLKALKGVDNISLQSHFSCSVAKVCFESGETLLINFIHRFLFDDLQYLDPGEVLEKKICNIELGAFQASLEHAFEYSVLSHYERKEWSEEHYRYFDEFHVLVKEDLLEYLNQKYGFGFRSLEHIFDYSDRRKVQICNSLRKLPANAFPGLFSLRWNRLLNFRSRASML